MTPSVLLDNARDRPGHARLYAGPRRIIRADKIEEVGAALEALDEAHKSGAHLAGFFSYELGYALEPRLAALMPEGRRVPLIWFGVFDTEKLLNGEEIEPYLAGEASGSAEITQPHLTLDREAYETRFETVKAYITAGDIYQLNLTLKGRFSCEGDISALYRDLRRKQPVSYGALVRTEDFSILSVSPELFLQVRNGIAVTRPMKGTAARGKTLEQDKDVAEWLSADIKSRAENLMIVDLMRNDLGRVAETGSVRVNDLYTVETYDTLHQMTSGVEATLRPGTGIGDLVRAIFPPGSVTGAPKVRAMEIIRELETEPRGVYTGAMGAISPDGHMLFNVAIRTLTLFGDGEGEIGIGSGVVHDSRAMSEYDECVLKMRFLTDPVRDFQLIETMLHEPGEGYALLERHLQRLKQSAEYFRFSHDAGMIAGALDTYAASLPGLPCRVRLLLYRDGEVEITHAEMAPGSTPLKMNYVVSEHVLDSTSAFLYHKTTERALYDTQWALMRDEHGADEVIFLNERGEVCEGSRTNIFARINGTLLTPALSSGLLPGTFRADMLERGEAEEARLTLHDLARAEAVYLGNSVRGLIPAREIHPKAARSA